MTAVLLFAAGCCAMWALATALVLSACALSGNISRCEEARDGPDW